MTHVASWSVHTLCLYSKWILLLLQSMSLEEWRLRGQILGFQLENRWSKFKDAVFLLAFRGVKTPQKTYLTNLSTLKKCVSQGGELMSTSSFLSSDQLHYTVNLAVTFLLLLGLLTLTNENCAFDPCQWTRRRFPAVWDLCKLIS